ncbi:hypothetical protein V8C35DRAFT_299088 [Trichoderma chlorosporum]
MHVAARFLDAMRSIHTCTCICTAACASAWTQPLQSHQISHRYMTYLYLSIGRDTLSLAESSVAKPPHSPSPTLESHSIHFCLSDLFLLPSLLSCGYATSAPLDQPLSAPISRCIPPKGLPCNRPCPRAQFP